MTRIVSILMMMAIALSPLPGHGAQLEKIRVATSHMPMSQFAGVYVALEKGFYREMGLDVELVWPKTTQTAIDMLAKGETDIIANQVLAVLLYNDAHQKAPIVNLLQTSQHSGLAIVSHEPIYDFEQLKNKKIGVWDKGFHEGGPAFTSTRYIPGVQWIKTSNNLAPFVSHAVDAQLVTTYNELFMLKMAGFDLHNSQIFAFRGSNFDIPDDGYYCMKGYGEKHLKQMRDFAEATKKGWRWLHDTRNREEGVSMTMNLITKFGDRSNRLKQMNMLNNIIDLQDINSSKLFKLDRNRFNNYTDLLLRNKILEHKAYYNEFVLSNMAEAEASQRK